MELCNTGCAARSPMRLLAWPAWPVVAQPWQIQSRPASRGAARRRLRELPKFGNDGDRGCPRLDAHGSSGLAGQVGPGASVLMAHKNYYVLPMAFNLRNPACLRTGTGCFLHPDEPEFSSPWILTAVYVELGYPPAVFRRQLETDFPFVVHRNLTQLVQLVQMPPLPAVPAANGSVASDYSRWKTAMFTRLPAERAVFLDGDTRVCHDLGPLFELVGESGFDMVCTHAHKEHGMQSKFRNRPDLIAKLPEAFRTCSGALVAVREGSAGHRAVLEVGGYRRCHPSIDSSSRQKRASFQAPPDAVCLSSLGLPASSAPAPPPTCPASPSSCGRMHSRHAH